jgi:hypothetical protein
MSWQEEFHPEVGYLLPSRKVRRLLRFAVLCAAFGIVVGTTGTLALLASRSESQSPEPPAYGIADAPAAAPVDPITAVPPPATVGDVPETASTPRFRFTGRRANCRSLSVAVKDGPCTFHWIAHTDVAATPSPAIPVPVNNVPSPGTDGAPARSKKPTNTAVRQIKRQNPTPEPPENSWAYATRGGRYGDRRSFDRGGFW